MAELKKATLAQVDAKGTVSQELPVQFNPTTLRLQMTNSIDTGNSKGRQNWTYNGTSSSTLTVELVFDTGDEGTSSRPADVRDKTAMVRRFMLPKAKSTDAPPSVRFHWGSFVLTGVMTSASEDLELFTAEGTPLRAKMNVSIKEQDPRFAAPKSPPKAAGGGGLSGLASGLGDLNPFGPGGLGLPADAANRLAEALDGESASDFLARNGLSPEAWRAVANGLEDTLSLNAGEPIGFNVGLPIGGISIGGIGSASIGGGFAVGVSASGSASISGTAVADAQAGLTGAGAAAGFALSAAGGLSAAIQAEARATTVEQAEATRVAFTATPAAVAPTPAGTAPTIDRHARLRDVAHARTAPPTAPAPATPPPLADSRAVSFGRGVPLRDRFAQTDGTRTNPSWVTVARRAPVESAAPVGTGCSAPGSGRGPGCGCA